MGILAGISTRKGPVHFTVKYRPVDGDWQWVKEQFSTNDGEVCFQSLEALARNLDLYLRDPDPALNIPSSPVTDGSVLIWPINTSIAAAGKQACFSKFRLGAPSAYVRWFCLVRQSRAWLCPRHGRHPFSLSEDAVLASFLLNDGRNLVLVAVSSGEILTLLNSDHDGNIIVSSRNDGQEEGIVEVFAAVATTFERANAALMAYIRNNIDVGIAVTEARLHEGQDKASSEAGFGKMEPWYDSLAYCTWNGLGQDLDERKLLSALQVLSDNNIKLSTMIIDDNWQSLDFKGKSHFGYRWTEFEANQKGFPNGLKHTISIIRKKYPYIENIAVWHGLFGYWNAVSPDGGIARTYKTRLAKKQETGFQGGGSITVVDADDVYRMYDDFYG